MSEMKAKPDREFENYLDMVDCAATEANARYDLRQAHRATLEVLRRLKAENKALRNANRSLRSRLAMADADRYARSALPSARQRPAQ